LPDTQDTIATRAGQQPIPERNDPEDPLLVNVFDLRLHAAPQVDHQKATATTSDQQCLPVRIEGHAVHGFAHHGHGPAFFWPVQFPTHHHTIATCAQERTLASLAKGVDRSSVTLEHIRGSE
jgi:hypothetical protein